MGMKLDMIAAGAYSVALERGMTEKDADAMVSGIIEKAAQVDDEYDRGDRTWWSDNKGWALPLAVGALAFWGGADAGSNGRQDRGYLSRLWDVWEKRFNALRGKPDNRFMDSLTKAK